MIDIDRLHKIPELPYDYDALEPYIDEETMRIHHKKHHQAYADKLKAALEKHPELFDKSIEEILRNLEAVPDDIRLIIRNHGGGYYNHNLFWLMMSPASAEVKGGLKEALERDFGSLDKFREEFASVALNHFGSGWAWLTKNRENKLRLYSLPNQDTPISIGEQPILTLDLWEHAYYLKYQNRRAEYIENWWNIVNWGEAARRYGS